MKTSKPRDTRNSLYVRVTDSRTNTSKCQVYYDDEPERVFDAIDAACEDAPATRDEPQPAASEH